MNKKLYRDEYHRVLGGVCSGLAEYFEMDVTLVRLLFAFTFFIMGAGLGTYIILWIVLPRKDYTFNNPNVDYTVPPQQSGQTFTTPPPPPPGSFSNRPYANNPFKADPIVNAPLKQKSHAGIIIGVVLIIIGGAILIDNYDLFPYIDFERLWPVILLVVGGGLILSGQTKQPWEKQDWNNPAKKEETSTDTSTAAGETTTPEA